MPYVWYWLQHITKAIYKRGLFDCFFYLFLFCLLLFFFCNFVISYCWIDMINSPKIYRIASMALEQSYNCFIITMTSWWARLRLKSPALRLFTQPFIQAAIKENIKAPRHWPLCGEFTSPGEFPAQMASIAEIFSIWWRHHNCQWITLKDIGKLTIN